MEPISRVYPEFGIFKGTNQNESQLYIDGVLGAAGDMFMARPIDLVLAKKSRNPFDQMKTGDLVAFFRCALVRESERGRRTMVESIYDTSRHPVFELPPLDLTRLLFPSLALIEGVKSGDVECVVQELLSGADPNSVGNDGNSALLCAVVRGCETVTSRLLAHGADPFCVNARGMSAYSLAQDRLPKFVPLLKKAEQQMATWEWIRKVYITAEPW